MMGRTYPRARISEQLQPICCVRRWDVCFLSPDHESVTAGFFFPRVFVTFWMDRQPCLLEVRRDHFLRKKEQNEIKMHLCSFAFQVSSRRQLTRSRRPSRCASSACSPTSASRRRPARPTRRTRRSSRVRNDSFKCSNRLFGPSDDTLSRLGENFRPVLGRSRL